MDAQRAVVTDAMVVYKAMISQYQQPWSIYNLFIWDSFVQKYISSFITLFEPIIVNLLTQMYMRHSASVS